MLPSLLEEILKEIEIFEITEAEFEIGKKAQIEDYLNTLIKPKARFQKEFLFLIGEPIGSLIENQPDSSDGKHMLKTENSDKKRGSVAFLPPPALPMAAT